MVRTAEVGEMVIAPELDTPRVDPDTKVMADPLCTFTVVLPVNKKAEPNN